jgi:hypothetical protein
MYNLLVANNSEEWNGDPFILEIDRCISVREYTDKKIAEKYGELSLAQVDEIIQFPCIFAYETQCHKDPKFGYIHEIVKRQGKVKIQYELIHLDNFLTFTDLEELHFELDIHSWEYNRTHWAIKDVDLQKELIAKGIKLPNRDSKDELMPINQRYDYDVALSFAGEDRIHAEALAQALFRRRVKVFYDKYEKNTLWGKDLYTHLSDLYQKKARYCVMFFSQSYVAKVWTRHELKSAQARALSENEEYILPIRLDSTEIPGILKTTAYLNWHEETPESVAEAVLEKLGKVSHTPLIQERTIMDWLVDEAQTTHGRVSVDLGDIPGVKHSMRMTKDHEDWEWWYRMWFQQEFTERMGFEPTEESITYALEKYSEIAE